MTDDYLNDDERGRFIGLVLNDTRTGVEDALRIAGDVCDFFVLADALIALRDLKATVAAAYAEVEALALSVMGDKKVEVPGVGLVESKKKAARSKWEHDDLFKHVVARIADEELLTDPETGERRPPAAVAAEVVNRLRDVMSPSWKVTGLRDLGIDETEFCNVRDDGYSLALPPRELA